MLEKVASYIHDFSHLFFPHNCLGCYSDVLLKEHYLCAECFSKLPETGFFQHANNTMEKIFYGRITVQQAGCAFYFNDHSVIHHLVLQFKYMGRKDIGNYLGKLMRNQLITSERFRNLDAVIALPLNKLKEKKRGYNQSAILAAKISECLQIPLLENVIERKIFTESQTTKTRVARWENMQNIFSVSAPEALENKHILLIDDIVTTGATLESCGMEILKVPGTSLSIATLAFTI